MRPAVRDALYDFQKDYEADIPWFYQDVRGLVSVGVGILADPRGLALSLPMRRPDGVLATPGEIIAEWERIKAMGTGDAYDDPPNPAAKGGHLYTKKAATLRLDAAGLRSTLYAKADIFDRQLAARFPSWEEWNCDAQLAIMSLTWACGAAFRFPKLDAALRRLDFLTASVEVKMDASRNNGLVRRNKANKVLLRNADLVETHDMDPEALYFPRDLATELPPDEVA